MPTNKTKVGEMINRRTPNSKTWMNLDGSYTTEIHSGLVHFEDENGNLQNINTDLFDEADLDNVNTPVGKEGASEYRVVKDAIKKMKKDNQLNRNNWDFQTLKVPFESKIPRNFKRGYTVGKGNDKLTFKPVHSSPSMGYVNQNDRSTINYQDAWNDADVELKVTESGIKETIILKTDRAPSSFSFEVKGPLQDDLTAGELKLMPAWLVDAEGTERDVEQAVRRENNKVFVDLIADITGLVYPIEIDPTTVMQTNGVTVAYVRQDSPDTNYGTTSTFLVGDDTSASDERRALIEADLSSIPSNSYINSATLEAYAHNIEGTFDIDAYVNVSDWSETTVTWNNIPSYTSYQSSYYSGGVGWHNWDVTPSTRDFVSGSETNNGWMLLPGNSSGNSNWFHTEDSSDSNKPKVTVNYNEPPTAPTVTAPNGGETWNAQHTITWDLGSDPENDPLQTELQLSTDDGSTWNTIVGLTSSGATSYTYDFSNESESSTCLIRARHYDGSSYSAYDQSDGVFTIQHNEAPDKANNLSPANGTPKNRATTTRFTWDHQDPNSDDPQSEFDLQWRVMGTSTWTTVNQVTPNEYWDAPGGTFPHDDIEWRVRTYDQEGLSGPYSNIVTFLAGNKPSAPTITSPTDGSTVSVANPTVQWSSSNQVSYTLRVLDSSGTKVYEHVGDTNKAHTVQYDLVNSADYTIELFITNADGLDSDVDVVSINVSYTAPAETTLAVNEDNSIGTITLQTTFPEPSGTEPTVTKYSVYRRLQGEGEWLRIAKEITPDIDYVDYTVASTKTHDYYIRAWGENGTYQDSDIVSGSVTLENAILTLVSDSSQWVEFDKVKETSLSTGVNRTMIQFAGRKRPVSYFNENEDWSVTLQCLVQGNMSMETLQSLANSRELLLYRDERGRKAFITLDGVEETDLPSNYYEVSLNPIQTHYDERV